MNEQRRTVAGRPRYSPSPLPPYSYVPGFTPHPVSDPAGHMYGQPHTLIPPIDPDAWPSSPTYLHAADLFNHGFYWEAHEAWEALWHAAKRTGPTAIWLKALIKLAAAGVKAREGNATGVERHARRSRELVRQLREMLSPAQRGSYCGLSLQAVDDAAESLAANARLEYAEPSPQRLLTSWLELRDC
jgi:hypothetical protein